ncbi:flagellar hook-length control protein FliK [Pseudogulbenkiania subflava]|uniref:Hook-length control protein FliK n=1 Tax=Pseudogulbenkiania subflava DSM 22618 TaxID=1123014 RepID=A0A1Y6C3N2_9NEIS|nr:flagellar hook-length control protein FliK [Pseudogulbenkiania subflava]SMF40138.1 hook-length control protein FliK [Pseudogulbenkiania subflava DSM 22618]
MISPLSGKALATTSVSGVRLLGEGGRLLLEAAVLPAKVPPLILGEQVSARVAERLDNGQFAALIKNGLFTLNLPKGMQLAGDTLTLRVTSLAPQLTFALVDQTADAEVQDGSVDVSLSPASRYLTDLLHSGKSVPAQPGLRLDASNQDTAVLAEALKKGADKSGLFYESHVKAWVDGRLPLESLKDEPQARLGQSLETIQGPSSTAHGKAAQAELGNLVQRQLDTLENRQLQLEGWAWPGQPIQLMVEQEKTAERQASGAEEGPVWSTRLALDLPMLGGLSARIRIVGGAVQVSFATEEAATEQLIRDHAGRLESGLGTAGLNLATLSVSHDEAPS